MDDPMTEDAAAHAALDIIELGNAAMAALEKNFADFMAAIDAESASDAPTLTATAPDASTSTATVPDASSLTVTVPTTCRKGFFDLPAEIRNMVYRKLFRPQTIMVRGKDVVLQGASWYNDTRRPTPRYLRDQQGGLNILFASKACYAEAKPVLLSRATFDINIKSMLNSEYPTRIQSQQKFGKPELSLIRKMTIPELPKKSIAGLQHCLTMMPFLRKITLVVPKRLKYFKSFGDPTQFDEALKWNKFVNTMTRFYDWNSIVHKILRNHVKKATKTARARIRYECLIDVHFCALNRDAVIHVDFIRKRVAIESKNGEEWLLQERKMPRLFRSLRYKAVSQTMP